MVMWPWVCLAYGICEHLEACLPRDLQLYVFVLHLCLSLSY